MKDATDITIVLDRSGSMFRIKSDVIGNFNAFLEEQKKQPDPATLTLVTFSDAHEVVYEAKPMQDAPALTPETYAPMGNTALRDTLGSTIDKTGTRLALMQEDQRPKRVLFVIMTDGMENASQEWDGPGIARLIKQQTDDYKWTFVYIGANQDSFTVGRELGISQTMDYAATPAGTSEVLGSMTRGVSNFRKGKGYTDPSKP